MLAYQVFRPDPAWSRNTVEKIVRQSNVPMEDIERVEIFCGDGGGLGAVICKDGRKVTV